MSGKIAVGIQSFNRLFIWLKSSNQLSSSTKRP